MEYKVEEYEVIHIDQKSRKIAYFFKRHNIINCWSSEAPEYPGIQITES